MYGAMIESFVHFFSSSFSSKSRNSKNKQHKVMKFHKNVDIHNAKGLHIKQQQIASSNVFGKTVYHYNRLMVTHIGMKLSTHTYSVLRGWIKDTASSVLAIQTDFSMAPFCMSLMHNDNG